MTASDYIATFLHEQGVTVVYEMIGGMITRLVDSLSQSGKFKIVSMHHEQAAGFAAEGWARMQSKPGVALATSGPGATNLVTAIGSCFFDYTPAVIITGQVNTHEMVKRKGVRQQGFQETDIVSIVRPITKAAWQVRNVQELPQILTEAFRTAMTPPKGPVLIDIPMDVQAMELAEPLPPATISLSTASEYEALHAWIKRFLADLRLASRPIILAGGGIRSADATEDLRKLVAATHIPVVHSLMGLDVLPYANPYRIGLIGTYGNRWANKALMQSDLVLVLGARLDIRQTGSQVEAFQQGRPFYQLDIEPSQINNRLSGCHGCVADLRDALGELARAMQTTAQPEYGSWMEQINTARQQWPDTAEVCCPHGIHPNNFIHNLSRIFGKAGAFVADVGKNQMWTAQSLELQTNQRALFSGGMGAMGFALPTAIGACFASQQETVVISGDGGIQCNIQELETIRHHNLPIKIVIINNQSLGMVQQFQEDYCGGRLQSTRWGYSAPDFCKVAKGYAIPGKKLTKPQDETALLKWFHDSNGPTLLEVTVDPFLKLFPKTTYGKVLDQMDPQ